MGQKGRVKPEKKGKKCMISKGDGVDREMVNKREQFLASEEIINYTLIPTIWLTREKVRVWETGKTI